MFISESKDILNQETRNYQLKQVHIQTKSHNSDKKSYKNWTINHNHDRTKLQHSCRLRSTDTTTVKEVLQAQSIKFLWVFIMWRRMYPPQKKYDATILTASITITDISWRVSDGVIFDLFSVYWNILEGKKETAQPVEPEQHLHETFLLFGWHP